MKNYLQQLYVTIKYNIYSCNKSIFLYICYTGFNRIFQIIDEKSKIRNCVISYLLNKYHWNSEYWTMEISFSQTTKQAVICFHKNSQLLFTISMLTLITAFNF